jgi:hypothetical protein
MDIPIFGKKHFLPRSSDIPRRTLKVAEGGCSQELYEERYEPFFSKGDRSQNISDSNEDWDQ